MNTMRKFAFMMAYYGASAVYQGYIALFYGGVGLNKAQIGAVNASAAVSAMLVQPLWGALGDKVRQRKRLLCLLSAMAALLLPAYLLVLLVLIIVMHEKLVRMKTKQ